MKLTKVLLILTFSWLLVSCNGGGGDSTPTESPGAEVSPGDTTAPGGDAVPPGGDTTAPGAEPVPPTGETSPEASPEASPSPQ